MKATEDRLKEIANHQLMFGSFTRNPGLFNGKMGLSIFFFHYARYTNHSLFEDFAAELLDEVLEMIHADTAIGFSNGLCGIGWGVEYLEQEGFVEGDTNEVLKEIDARVMEYAPTRMVDRTFESGLAGLAVYVRMRMQSAQYLDGVFNDTFLDQLNAVALPSYTTSAVRKLIVTNQLCEKEPLSWKAGLEILWS